MMTLIFSDILLLFLFSLVFTVLIGVGAFLLYKKYAPAGWNFKTGTCYVLIVLASLFLSLPTFGGLRMKSYTKQAQTTCETLIVDYINSSVPGLDIATLASRFLSGNLNTDAAILAVLETGSKLFDFKEVIVQKYPYLDKFIPEVTIEKVLDKAGVTVKEITSLDYLARLVSNYCFSGIHDFLNSFIYKCLIIYLLLLGLPSYLIYRDIKKKKAIPDIYGDIEL